MHSGVLSIQQRPSEFPLKCWMTVTKSRETCAVYMQQDRGWGQYICSMYAARQGMRALRACDNNNMCKPIIRGVTHVIIVACPHLLSCCIYILPSSPVLLHIYCTCFSTFWHCYPYILQHFNGNVFTHFSYKESHIPDLAFFRYMKWWKNISEDLVTWSLILKRWMH